MGASAVSGIVSSSESVAVGFGGEQGPRVLDISAAGGRGYQAPRLLLHRYLRP